MNLYDIFIRCVFFLVLFTLYTLHMLHFPGLLPLLVQYSVFCCVPLSTHMFFKPPPPVGAGGGYMFSGRPSVRASVRPSVRP